MKKRLLIVNNNLLYKPMLYQAHLLKKIATDLGYKVWINAMSEVPDVAVVVNSTRLDYPEIPKSCKVISWFQDSTGKHCREEYAERWNRECIGDVIVGYTDILSPFGYDQTRMFYLPMLPDYYHFNETHIKNKERQNIVTFISNKGEDIDSIIKYYDNVISNAGLTLDESRDIANALSDTILKYFNARSAPLIGTVESINDIVKKYMPESFYNSIKWLYNPNLKSLQIFFFWHIYERLLRQKIVFDIQQSHIYTCRVFGEGWVSNKNFPFSGHAVDYTGLRQKLGSSKFGLHVNSYYGYHQRILEILFCGTNVLFFNPWHDKDVATYKPERFNKNTILSHVQIYADRFWSNILKDGRTNQEDNSQQLKKILDVHKYCYYFKNIDELATIKKLGV